MTYINKHTGKKYYGGSITIKYNGIVFSGIPTQEQLTEWGFVEYIPPTPPEQSEDELEPYLSPYEALQIITGKE